MAPAPAPRLKNGGPLAAAVDLGVRQGVERLMETTATVLVFCLGTGVRRQPKPIADAAAPDDAITEVERLRLEGARPLHGACNLRERAEVAAGDQLHHLVTARLLEPAVGERVRDRLQRAPIRLQDVSPSALSTSWQS
jgi:hypothetical protein